MTDADLIQQLETLIRSERRITHQIIELIQIAESRKLYLEQGYGSLFDWLTKYFHYSSSAAYRRIQAARLLSSLPEHEEHLKEKIHSGSLNLTALSKVQSFIKEEEKRSGEKVSSALKTEILDQIENQSIQTTEKILFRTFPESGQSLHAERISALNEDDFRISLTLSEETLSELKRVQELLGHRLPEASLSEVIAYLSKDFLKRKDPLQRPRVMTSPTETATNTVPTRDSRARSAAVLRGGMKVRERRRGIFVTSSKKSSEKNLAQARRPLSVRVRRFVFQRDQGRCQYKHPLSGKLCGSRKQIEIDHIHPLSLGGSDTASNLRCLCRNHNQWRAEKTFLRA